MKKAGIENYKKILLLFLFLHQQLVFITHRFQQRKKIKNLKNKRVCEKT